MLKVAVVVLADNETMGDLGRVVNALQVVKEFKESEAEVQLLFDGAGVRWIGKLTKPEHKYKELFEEIRDKIAGVCGYCAEAFGAKETVAASGLPLAKDYEGHPSFKKLLSDGFQILVF
jgi:hypothetical protein